MVQLRRYSKHRLQIRDLSSCKRDKSITFKFTLPVNKITSKYLNKFGSVQKNEGSHRGSFLFSPVAKKII